MRYLPRLLLIIAVLPLVSSTRAATTLTPWGDGRAFFFECTSFGNDDRYARYDPVAQAFPQPPAPVVGGLAGWPAKWYDNDTSAAVEWGDGKIYFFNQDSYLRYDLASDLVDPGYPLPIRGNWPGWPASWTRVDAAVNWGNGKVYFFNHDQYLRYDIAADRVDPGYPLPIIGNWPGWPADWPGVSAAARFPNGKVYFFRESQYLRYDVASDQVDQGPQPIAGNWPGMPSNWAATGVSGGLTLDGQFTYFFGGLGDYVRFNIAQNRVDVGPAQISENWGVGGGARTWPLEWFCPKATLNYGNEHVYVFSQGNYVRFNLRQNKVDFGPAPLADYWTGWPAGWTLGPEAAAYIGDDTAIFFWRDEYLRYNTRLDRVEPGFPRKIDADFPGWPATWDYVTAALAYGDGKLYLFSTSTGTVVVGPLHYLQVDLATSTVDAGFPKPVAGNLPWPAYYLNAGGALGGTEFPPYELFLPLSVR